MNLKSLPLNRFTIEMVRPKKCLMRRLYHNDTMNFENCNRCDFRNNDNCEWEEVVVDAARGEFCTDGVKGVSDEFTTYYMQFCCGKCKEIIQSKETNWWGAMYPEEIKCKKCGTLHVLIHAPRGADDKDKNRYVFAIPARSSLSDGV